jgi:hypothetical protein
VSLPGARSAARTAPGSLCCLHSRHRGAAGSSRDRDPKGEPRHKGFPRPTRSASAAWSTDADSGVCRREVILTPRDLGGDTRRGAYCRSASLLPSEAVGIHFLAGQRRSRMATPKSIGGGAIGQGHPGRAVREVAAGERRPDEGPGWEMHRSKGRGRCRFACRKPTRDTRPSASASPVSRVGRYLRISASAGHEGWRSLGDGAEGACVKGGRGGVGGSAGGGGVALSVE